MQSLSGLPKRAVSENLLSLEQAQELTELARSKQTSFVFQAVNTAGIDPVKLALCASEEFSLPLLDLSRFNTEWIPENVISEKLIQTHHVIPLTKRGKRLFIAQSDPSNHKAVDDIKFNTNLNIETVVVAEHHLSKMIDRLLNTQESVLDDLDDSLEDIDLEDPDLELEQEQADTGATAADDAPVVRFVNKMLLDAIKQGASDIHFEPYEKRYRVRYRTDGVLFEVANPPSNLSTRLAARLKVMSRMDISERRLPQDGRIKMKISKTKSIDFRVNTLPTVWGEKIVLRILDSSSAQLGIDSLGYESDQKQLYLDALARPQGMILVTGPTGSGKTVSLYTGLNILNEEKRNISTVEDPVEINLEGINQVNVNTKVGLDFSSTLRAFLRQDPDVVMVGEIRDLETAQISIKAAQTGHLVLSTLHTNSAAETLTRLVNMGIPSFNIATSVSLIIAQRLARRLCNECKEPVDIPHDALLEIGFTEEMLSSARIYKAKGCHHCKDGYKGRVGVYEVVKITSKLANAIMEGANSLRISEIAQQEGFPIMRESALRKVAQGLISLEEANRITVD